MTVPLVPDTERPQPVGRAFLQASCCLICLICLALLHVCGRAQAQAAHAHDAESASTPHVLALISGGAPLRLTVDRDLGQKRLGPLFGNVLLGYAMPGGRLQQGFGVGVSWNATHDGGYTTPLYALDQVVVMPSYLAYYQLNADLFGVGHIGLPVVVRGGLSAGLEVGAAIAYRIFSGAGVFAGLDLNSQLALGLNVFASLELGVAVDYEVLP